MLKFGFSDLLQGAEVTTADADPAQVIVVDAEGVGGEVTEAAPPKIGRWRMREDLASDDFESPGMEADPRFVPPEEYAFPFENTCAVCAQPYLCVPFLWRGRGAGFPRACGECEKKWPPTPHELNPLWNPQIGWERYYIPGRAKTFDNIEGYRLTGTRSGSITSPATKPVKPATAPAPAKSTPNTSSKMCKCIEQGYPDIDCEVHGLEKEIYGAADVVPTNIPSTGPIGHHKNGPSSLKAKDACSHWQNTPGGGPAAEEGTMMHGCLETGDTSMLNEEQRTNVLMVRGLFDRLLADMGAGAVAIQERRLNVANLTWGTADEVLFSADRTRAKVLDAKFGYVEVDDAMDNWQGQCYTLGVWFEWESVEEVEVVFAQPRLAMVTRHTFTRAADYDRIYTRVSDLIRRIEDPTQPYNPSPDNCRFCNLQPSCPAVRKVAIRTAERAEFGGFAIPESLVPETMTDATVIAQGLRLAEFFTNWSDRMKAHAREFTIMGGDLPGYTLAHKSVPRGITDPMLAWVALKNVMAPEAFMSAIKTLSVPKLEEAFAASAPRGAKKQSKQQLEDLLRDSGCLRDEGQIPYLKRDKVAKTAALSAPTKTNAIESEN